MKLYNFLNETINILFFDKYHILSDEELKIKENLTVKEICKKYAKGNISLSSGKYLTSHQLEERRKEILAYRFY